MKKNPNKNPLKDYLQESNSGEFGAINPDSESKSSNLTKKAKILKKTKKNNINNPGLLNTLKHLFK